MRMLILGFAGRTYPIVGNLMHWLIKVSYTKQAIDKHEKKSNNFTVISYISLW